jgi:tocopherol cyclase
MLRKVTKKWKPAIYQGNKKMKGYFEGWYFKLVDYSRNNVYAIIPGVSFEKDGKTKHSFIQIFDGNTGKTWYQKYSIEDFTFSKKDFDLKIGDNSFSHKGLSLDIKTTDLAVKGKISFDQLRPWPVTFFTPGVMGWYTFVPFMECYHGIVSFDHRLTGKLNINGEIVDFTEGRGYIEKDWGKSFPEYWIWMQTNHFKKENTSMMASIANIPWIGRSFDGFLAGIYLNDEVHRFTTYNGTKITKLQLEDDKVAITLQNRKEKLEIMAFKSKGAELAAPIMGKMEGRILESITAKIHIKLFNIKKKTEQLIFDDIGTNAGLEIGGKIEKLRQI